MSWSEGHIGSGIADLDELIGGLVPGDNVVWVADNPAVMSSLEASFLTEAGRARLPQAYVTTAASPEAVRKRVGKGVKIFDARPRQAHGEPAVLEQSLLELCRSPLPACVVLDGLDVLVRRWRPERALAYFSRVCPRMFDAGAIAYWRAPREELGDAFLDQVQKVTQCVLEIQRGRLRVVKAEGRPSEVQGLLMELSLDEGGVHLHSERALGRLGRGLEQLRKERGLSQADIARFAGVSASAISQAESGRSGLSLDTLLSLCEGVGISLDALLGGVHESGYVLARRDRTRRAATHTALLDDPSAGLRAYLVVLHAGETGVPPTAHKGPELVLIASGLVQVRVGEDTPVMRSGDALLATRAVIDGWRNLTTDTARLFWVLRD